METWYLELIKPTWAPPAWVFGPVWSVLYTIIIVTFGYAVWLFFKKKISFITLLPFLLNLVFNLSFTWIQFGLMNNVLAGLDVLLVLGTLIWAMIAIYPHAKWVSLANVPYLLWVSFATVLQLTITALNLEGAESIPWLDILGLFLFIAGFVIGLGAVTVIDLHGFLGRKSKYWTEATIRTHKVTKPLIWIGTLTATVGGMIYYRPIGLTSTAVFHLLLLVVLILNGLFLSFVISPYLLKQEKSKTPDKLLPQKMQTKIIFSFIVSFLGWWSSLLLLVWHILVLR